MCLQSPTITCPRCEAVWSLSLGRMGHGETKTVECPECGLRFDVQVLFDVIYALPYPAPNFEPCEAVEN